ncbi:MAG: S46 family peptidase [Bacteroidetes bacterium]|nr:S46 family peptidase [Bacteroidota bacterium]MDA1336229.1 S46 family peptidase [Bacteroidota bacterium]
MRITTHSFLFLFVFFLNVNLSSAKEGMWIPTLLQAVEGDMQSMGLHLSAEDIFSINQGSLKDAIVHFNGGCTAEMVSSEGLLLTNHHCGYSQIAYHSTVEHDYLTDGFWAMSRDEELPNPNLVATFIDGIVDVTNEITSSTDPEASKEALIEAATDGTGLEGSVVAFDFGNSFFLITTKTYRDVRLVGAPPSAVGKFGGDTDNWVWPRHTGDFSIFRIYADAGNNPVDYSEDNVPYHPGHHFPVDIGGVKEGDFTMVFGFPGRTEQYLTSDAVEFVIETLNPARIEMRDASLAVINAARASSPALKIAYADKQSSISNAWKKWIGQNNGLIELEALEKKRALEAEFMSRASEQGDIDQMQLIAEIQAVNADHNRYYLARSLFIEWVYYGPDILNFAWNFSSLIEKWEGFESEEELNAERMKLEAITRDHFRQYDATVDAAIMAALVEPYIKHMDAEFIPEELLVAQKTPEVWSENLFEKSVFSDETALLNLLEKGQQKSFTKLAKDPAFALIKSMRSAYFTKVAQGYGATKDELDSLTGAYTRALRALFPERAFFPDANSTLRLTYGKVEGSSPYDGMEYRPFTTTQGILQKYVPGDPDFDLPEDLVEALNEADWGEYANEKGELPVCFTGSNHTTGGNSGSPAIDGDGHLVGINFDRSWESTMSDILFDGSRCRNIMVDIRYVLWITDVYAGAGHLVDEMEVVRD